jgi:RNA polymerase sigma-70 factor, ECF subfamily
LAAPSDPSVILPPRTDIAWLQPFPDRLWEPVAPSGAQPDVAVVARETIELPFLAAIQHLPERRLEWAPSPEPTERERAVLRRYMDAVERADLAAVAALLAEDVRATMPPYPMWFQGRDTVVATLAASWDPGLPTALPPTHR